MTQELDRGLGTYQGGQIFIMSELLLSCFLGGTKFLVSRHTPLLIYKACPAENCANTKMNTSQVTM